LRDRFHTLIQDLERENGSPIALSSPRSFEMLFEPDLPVTSALNDDDSALVTDVWISDITEVPGITQQFLLGALLEMNYYASLENQATFALDDKMRIVLSRSDDLGYLTAPSYLNKLSVLIEQAQRLRRLLLILYPRMTVEAPER
jgi:hypothetical protein